MIHGVAENKYEERVVRTLGETVERVRKKTENYPMKRIAVTGSIGKTTVRRMITHILAKSMKIVHTEASFNTVTQSSKVLEQADEGTQAAVLEFGTAHPNGLVALASYMSRPDVGIITMIGTSHIGNFGSREAILKAKLGILDGMSKGSCILLNYDDDLLRITDTGNVQKIYVSQANPDADVYAEDIRFDGQNVVFYGCFKGKNDTITRIPVVLYGMGPHNVINALFAIEAANRAGLPRVSGASRLASFRCHGVRQKMLTIHGIKIILDCFNASPESIKAALDMIEQIEPEKEGRRIAVIGDVLELGKFEDELHLRIADYINKSSIDFVILFGIRMSHIQPHLRREGLGSIAFLDSLELESYLNSILRRGDVVLVKGSHDMKLDVVSENVMRFLRNE